MDWTTILVGVVVALSTLGATFLSNRASERARFDETTEARRAARRDAYLELLREVDRIHSHVRGIEMLGSAAILHSEDRLGPFTFAAAAVEIHAPESVWADVAPLVEVTNVLVNRIGNARVGSVPDRVFVQRLTELDAMDGDGLSRLRLRAVEAFRRDLI